MKIQAWTVFGAKSRPGRLQDAPPGNPGIFLSIFEILFGFMGPFSGPREIADRSRIVLLIIDGHFDPRKMPSGSGVRKNMNV